MESAELMMTFSMDNWPSLAEAVHAVTWYSRSEQGTALLLCSSFEGLRGAADELKRRGGRFVTETRLPTCVKPGPAGWCIQLDTTRNTQPRAQSLNEGVQDD